MRTPFRTLTSSLAVSLLVPLFLGQQGCRTPLVLDHERLRSLEGDAFIVSTLSVPRPAHTVLLSMQAAEGDLWLVYRPYSYRPQDLSFPLEGWLARWDSRTEQVTAIASIRFNGPGPPLMRESMAVGEDHVWVLSPACDGDSYLYRVERRSGLATRLVLEECAAAIVLADGAAWISSATTGRIWRVDPVALRIVQQIDTGYGRPDSHHPLAAGAGAIWVLDQEGAVTRIDPESGEVVSHIRIGEAHPRYVGPGGLFPPRVPMCALAGACYSDIRVGEGSVWVAKAAPDQGATILRIDPKSNQVTATIPVSHHYPRSLVVHRGYLWATTFVELGSLVLMRPAHWCLEKIDPRLDEVVDQLCFRDRPRSLLRSWEGRIWAYHESPYDRFVTLIEHE